MSADNVTFTNAARPIVATFRLLGFLLMLFTLIYGIYAWYLEKQQTFDKLQALSANSAYSARQYFDHYKQGMRGLSQDLLAEGGLAQPQRAHVLLKRFQLGNPDLNSVNLVTADGQMFLSSLVPVGQPLPHLRRSAVIWRGFEETLRGQGFNVLPACQGLISGNWVIPMQLPVRDAKGRLRFVLSVSLPVARQQGAWRGLTPESMVHGLMRNDAYLQSRYPNPADFDFTFASRRQGPLVQALRSNPGRAWGTYQGTTEVDDEYRLGAYTRLQGYPLTAFVSVPLNQVFSGWIERVQVPFAMFFLLALAGIGIYQRGLRWQMRIERERQRAEREVRQLNAELEQRVAERTAELLELNAELESFSYSVSHDLRAPLRVVDSFSQILLQDCGERLQEGERRHLRRIHQASQRMGNLIEDLLSLSRVTRQEMRCRPVNLGVVARQIADHLQQPGLTARQVDFRIAPDVPAYGDERLLRIVLENLIGNAWKFTGKRADACIEFGMLREGEERIYFVRDNGAGFDMNYAGKLFSAFQRLHSMQEFEGTGIGLATVARIIHRHGGKVWAQGGVDEGATFFFTLRQPAILVLAEDAQCGDAELSTEADENSRLFVG
ncbi:ATP-binding protein [Thermithiobacillus plumbiphilus]|uniref:histidine kinase n=1 Tax=Thermithiobacillus plumbiphilus TaxID=1729899 RepID=A0ABU9D8M9_9PROT